MSKRPNLPRSEQIYSSYSPQAMKLLWLEVEHRFAIRQIDRHRVLMVHNQPLAVDLTEASGPTQPEIGLLPSVHGSAYPVEAVGEGNVIAHRDGQVVNFIAYRTLERREYLFPGFPECICSHVSQRGHDVERHDLRRVERHDASDVLVTNRLDPTLYYPFDCGFIVFLVFFDCHCSLLLVLHLCNQIPTYSRIGDGGLPATDCFEQTIGDAQTAAHIGILGPRHQAHQQIW